MVDRSGGLFEIGRINYGKKDCDSRVGRRRSRTRCKCDRWTTQINGKRGRRTTINHHNVLRVKGYPICASGEGYYWPSSAEELKQYIFRFHARIDDVTKAITGMETGYDKIRPEVAKSQIEANKVYYYEVGNQPDVRCIEVAGSKLGEFLAKYPTARKIAK